MHQSYLKMSHRCLIEDDLSMTYEKMFCRCLIQDNLQMSYQKMSCMRCLKDQKMSCMRCFKDVLYNLFLNNLSLRYVKPNLKISSFD